MRIALHVFNFRWKLLMNGGLRFRLILNKCRRHGCLGLRFIGQGCEDDVDELSEACLS